MKTLHEHLLWLERTPEDFDSKLKDSKGITDLLSLSKHYLDLNKLHRLEKRIKSFNEGQDSQIRSLKIGILGSSTTDLIAPSISATGLRHNLNLSIFQSEFNQIHQIVNDENNTFFDVQHDVILLAIDFRWIPINSCLGNKKSTEETIKQTSTIIKNIISKITEKTDAMIVLQNIVLPSEDFFGSYESQLPGTPAWILNEINSQISNFSSENLIVWDINKLAATIGYSNWHNPKIWNVAKQPFDLGYVPIYADHFCRLIAAKYGLSKRCVILDLDNTLWGGVIGDDGLSGIKLGNGSAVGESYTEFQRHLIELHNRGIILSVCSKNEKDTAVSAFNNHPDMILKLDNIASFRANWRDKASNIREISETLSLGLQSMVFIDDNPAERMQVRRELPEVSVPEMPEDPAMYSRILLATGYFEAITFSSEDSNRAQQYKENEKRLKLKESSSDMSGYLNSLSMEIEFKNFDDIGRPRITQLISKSNQFNLTTKRYSQKEVKDIEESNSYFTRQIRLTDTFGDNGMISVIICKKGSNFWEIDTWLMSCRVIGRSVEESVLNEIVNEAKKEGAKKIVGKFIPTKKNMMVRDLYKRLGFEELSENNEEISYELDLNTYKAFDIPIKIID